ncbi:MAG: hypothetical protein IPJ50_19405 [Betaproteobacteria bacterium]|nr:hypothetical protein [Betaproteobacteria bacterium]
MSDEVATELAGWEKTRPLRVAFLVEPGEYANLMLDGIFADCYSRWGGRFSLIIPCADGRIVGDYWSWLETFDPEIVYSYVELAGDAVLEIHERLVPADYILHRLGDEPRLDLFGFRPKYHFAALSSLSTVFRLGRHSPLADGPRIKIIDSWHTERPTRFLTDNLGTYHTSAATGMYPNDARSIAGLLTVVSEEHFQERKYAVPRDLDRVATEGMALAEFACRRATGISLLSSLYAQRLEIRDHRWSGAFNLVIGESFEDRLLFWNARLLIPAWLDTDLCCFRLTREQLMDGDLVKSLAQLINSHNHVNGGSGGQAQLQVRSASHSVDELAEILSLLRDAKVWSASGPVEVVPGGHVIPSEDSLRHARERAQAMDGRHRGTEWHGFRWKPPVARPPVMEPEHLKDAPPGQSFTLGCWALDLSFEYERNKPRFTQDNVWMLPKRWRMAGAFEAKFATRGFGQNLPPMCRTSMHGNLVVFAGVDQALESIRVPSIDEAMQRALCCDSAIWRVDPGDPPWPSQKAQWVRPSSEDPHLTGILGMTGSLASARSLLLHPFLQEMFAALGGAPNLADADVRTTADSLAKRARGRPLFDLQLENERTALAALIVKAAQSVKAPKMHVALDYLRERWKAYRESYWAQRPDEMRRGTEEERKEWDAREQRAIDDCLAKMRFRRMLFQGYPWTCGSCRHRNWTDFQALSHSLKCDVCLTEKELPVGIPWHFRPNEFLIESLRSHSVLSLVWVLSALLDRAHSSFMYLGPTCLGYSQDYDNPDAEADLLAIVDGESILCEVKSAWRSLRTVHVEDFVGLAKRLRPDRAILAVMEEGKRLDDEIRNAEGALKADGIKFELLTPAAYRVDGDPFLFC